MFQSKNWQLCQVEDLMIFNSRKSFVNHRHSQPGPLEHSELQSKGVKRLIHKIKRKKDKGVPQYARTDPPAQTTAGLDPRTDSLQHSNRWDDDKPEKSAMFISDTELQAMLLTPTHDFPSKQAGDEGDKAAGVQPSPSSAGTPSTKGEPQHGQEGAMLADAVDDVSAEASYEDELCSMLRQRKQQKKSDTISPVGDTSRAARSNSHSNVLKEVIDVYVHVNTYTEVTPPSEDEDTCQLDDEEVAHHEFLCRDVLGRRPRASHLHVHGYEGSYLQVAIYEKVDMGDEGQATIVPFTMLDDLNKMLGQLVDPFEDSFYFWQCYEITRRLLQTGVVVLMEMAFGTTIAVAFALLVAYIALLLHKQYKPYMIDSLDHLQGAILVNQLVVQFFMMFLLANGEAERDDPSVIARIITVILLLLQILVFWMAYKLIVPLFQPLIESLRRNIKLGGDHLEHGMSFVDKSTESVESAASWEKEDADKELVSDDEDEKEEKDVRSAVLLSDLHILVSDASSEAQSANEAAKVSKETSSDDSSEESHIKDGALRGAGGPCMQKTHEPQTARFGVHVKEVNERHDMQSMDLTISEWLQSADEPPAMLPSQTTSGQALGWDGNGRWPQKIPHATDVPDSSSESMSITEVYEERHRGEGVATASWGGTQPAEDLNAMLRQNDRGASGAAHFASAERPDEAEIVEGLAGAAAVGSYRSGEGREREECRDESTRLSRKLNRRGTSANVAVSGKATNGSHSPRTPPSQLNAGRKSSVGSRSRMLESIRSERRTRTPDSSVPIQKSYEGPDHSLPKVQWRSSMNTNYTADKGRDGRYSMNGTEGHTRRRKTVATLPHTKEKPSNSRHQTTSLPLTKSRSDEHDQRKRGESSRGRKSARNMPVALQQSPLRSTQGQRNTGGWDEQGTISQRAAHLEPNRSKTKSKGRSSFKSMIRKEGSAASHISDSQQMMYNPLSQDAPYGMRDDADDHVHPHHKAIEEEFLDTFTPRR